MQGECSTFVMSCRSAIVRGASAAAAAATAAAAFDRCPTVLKLSSALWMQSQHFTR